MEYIKKVIVPSSSLATFGVLITAICVGAFAKYILNISWAEGLLLGAIVSSTDAAAIFATLGSVYVNRRLSATLEAESGMNDPMAVILTLSLITFVQNPEISILHTLLGFLANYFRHLNWTWNREINHLVHEQNSSGFVWTISHPISIICSTLL